MGLGYKSSSVIGGPLDPSVIKQLETRGKKLQSRTRTREDVVGLNSKTGWVRLSSSVNVKGSSNLAKSNILVGGTLNESTGAKSGFSFNNASNPAYKVYDHTGIRPMPGITSVNINSKNTFGTLRQASVEFKCWSVEQLKDMEQLYMRPGFSVLLEWGNSLYFDNASDKFTTDVNTVSDYFIHGKTKEQVQGSIDKLKQESSNNYDGMFGYVKNFQWSYNIDGGYDCKCDIISMGEIIESIRVIVTPSQASGDSDNIVSNQSTPEEGSTEEGSEVTEELARTSTPIHTFLSEVSRINLAQELEGGKKKIRYGSDEQLLIKLEDIVEKKAGKFLAPKLWESFVKGLAGRTFNILDYRIDSPRENFRYIKLRDFLILLNNSFIYGERQGKKLVKFNTDESKSCFYTFPNHSALDLGIAVLPKEKESKMLYKVSALAHRMTEDKAKVAEYAKSNAESTYKYFSEHTKKLELGKVADVATSFNPDESILNIFCNVDFLISELDILIKNPEPTVQTVQTLVKNILAKIQATTGNINEFDIFYQEDIFEFFVIDRKLTPDKKDLSVINLTGLRSSVTNLSFTSKITPKLSTMLAISAQTGGTDVGIEAENMFRWNEGLTDRILPQKNFDTSSTEVREKNQTQRLQESVKSYADYIVNIENVDSRVYNQVEIQALIPLHARLMNGLIVDYGNTGAQEKRGGAGIIPFELNITLDGIGGVKIGQAFKVASGILPETYDDVIGFLVNGVDHTIQNNRWETSLRAQTIVLKGSIQDSKIDTEVELTTTDSASPTIATSGLPETGTVSTTTQIDQNLPTQPQVDQGTIDRLNALKIQG